VVNALSSLRNRKVTATSDLIIGIPKTPHVLPGVMKLFAKAKLHPMQPYPESLSVSFSRFSNGTFGGQALVLKPRRLAILIARGKVDVGIIGQDILQENGVADIVVLADLTNTKLGLRETRVGVIASSRDVVYDASDIPEGSFVITEYERLTRNYFMDMRKYVHTIPSPGGVEAEIPLFHRFGVAVVDSGNTLHRENLQLIGTITTSRPVLVTWKRVLENPDKAKAICKLAERLTSAVA